MSGCPRCFCKSVTGCLSCLFCDILNCECNCIIFPSQRASFSEQLTSLSEGPVKATILSFITQDKQIPYVQVSTHRSRLSKKCIIYFHGNAQDIGQVSQFLQPIVQDLGITFYAIEYPTYSYYSVWFPALISNTIKTDSLLFYDFLLKSGRCREDIYVMGRSIGTGGATYLAAHKNVPYLILMSPFDTIRKVAQTIAGCLGCVVKQHFDNEHEIVEFKGELLVIHGESDEVIGVRHGKHLVEVYDRGNSYKNSATTLYPKRMTHNNFNIERDIIAPIKAFLNK